MAPAGLALHGWSCIACEWTAACGGVTMRKELAAYPKHPRGAAAGLCSNQLTHITGILIQSQHRLVVLITLETFKPAPVQLHMMGLPPQTHMIQQRALLLSAAQAQTISIVSHGNVQAAPAELHIMG